ncbi:MAG: hypothetical protein HY720_23500 [Planctomycetes bacterium]|nr:hypothetical protein [Planctomycetota bacterium]
MKVSNRMRNLLVSMLLSAIMAASSGCQYVSEDIDEYPADMFNRPLDGPLFVTLPTWFGGVIGAGAGAGMLPLSWTAALFVDTWFPEVYAQEQDRGGLFVVHDGFDVAIMPIMGFGYLTGILTGTPFYVVYFPYEVTKNVILGNEREPEGDVRLKFRETPIREERPTTPEGYPAN